MSQVQGANPSLAIDTFTTRLTQFTAAILVSRSMMTKISKRPIRNGLSSAWKAALPLVDTDRSGPGPR
jgi:hypothetical protein